ncbi:MAG TPA: hypothetical protein DEB39_00655 [Planctomycetaceae bacterium]|nr:hypothetical protein [Planctomycetaceae bacterium]
MKRFLISFFLLFFFPVPANAEVVAPNGAKRLDGVTTSWIGNSFGGIKDGKPCWVQQDIAAMHVCDDGTVYTNVPWEEAGGNCSMYKDGWMLGAAWHTHGWGYEGGKAVTANEKYVFIGQKVENEGGGLVDAESWPSKGFQWYGVSRRLRSDFTKGAPFEHGKGGKGDTLPKSFLVVNEVPLDARDADGNPKHPDEAVITGLWAASDRLYVSNPYEGRIEIYDTESMVLLDTWAVPSEEMRPIRQIAADKDGNLWVLVERPREKLLADRFLVFDKDGTLFREQGPGGKTRYCPIAIPENHEENFPHNYHPSAFCFDPEGRLLVADTGIWQSVFFFERKETDGVPEYVPTKKMLGWPAVILRSDAFGETVFRNITAIGCDAVGNVHVASDWATNGGGTVLESYAPAQKTEANESGADAAVPIRGNFSFDEEMLLQSRWKLNWRLLGLCFIDCATLDPAEETMVYTKEERFKLDYSKAPGEEATFLGTTEMHLNRSFKTNDRVNNCWDMFRDPRLNIGDSAAVWVRTLAGEKFLFVNDMNGQFLQVYRLGADTSNTNEETLPTGAVALFSQRHIKDRPDWLPGQPEKGEWIWRKMSTPRSSQIFMDAKEFESHGFEDAPASDGWWVDAAGDVWQASLKDGIRRFRFQGLDEFTKGPIWNYANVDHYPHPAELTQLKRIRYDVETDTLYLGGCGTVDGVEHTNQHWKPMGPVVCRYDHFLKGSNPGNTEGKRRWLTVLPYVAGSRGHESCEPMGFDIAGEYLFAPYTGASKESGFKTGHVEVYRLEDAVPVGWMEPDPETVGEVGLQDMRECLSAHRKSDGEYIVFLEDDYKAKVVMYRFKDKKRDRLSSGTPIPGS